MSKPADRDLAEILSKGAHGNEQLGLITKAGQHRFWLQTKQSLGHMCEGAP